MIIGTRAEYGLIISKGSMVELIVNQVSSAKLFSDINLPNFKAKLLQKHQNTWT